MVSRGRRSVTLCVFFFCVRRFVGEEKRGQKGGGGMEVVTL